MSGHEITQGDGGTVAISVKIAPLLSADIRIEVIRYEGVYHASIGCLDAIGVGATIHKALQDLLEGIESDWTTIKDDPDFRLTKAAIEIRDKLRQLFNPIT